MGAVAGATMGAEGIVTVPLLEVELELEPAVLLLDDAEDELLLLSMLGTEDTELFTDGGSTGTEDEDLPVAL
ncbi:Uncharacterised protein [Legionella maceachernii]|nr:Uncharacterised protein [Legionella maceachernii]